MTCASTKNKTKNSVKQNFMSCKALPKKIQEYYTAIKKDKILPFATTWMDLEGITWMDLEGIILSVINRIEKDKCHMISLICGI